MSVSPVARASRSSRAAR